MRVQRLYFSQGRCDEPKIKMLQNAIINLYKRMYVSRVHLYFRLFYGNSSMLPHKDALFMFIKPRCLHTREKEKRTI